MLRSFLIFFFVLTMVLLPSSLLARPKQGSPADSFALIDTDDNEAISLKEFMEARPNLREHAFTVIDKDEDQAIDLEEWEAFSHSHKKDMAGTSLPNDEDAAKKADKE